jgi:hypothetical protein
MSGGLVASWENMRVTNPRTVTSRARIIGVVARWVT